MYASTTHCCPARPVSRSSSIAGSATLTTVESRKTIVEPRIVAISVSRSLRVMRRVWQPLLRDLCEGGNRNGDSAPRRCDRLLVLHPLWRRLRRGRPRAPRPALGGRGGRGPPRHSRLGVPL